MSKEKFNKLAKLVELQMADLEKNKDKYRKEREEKAQSNPSCLSFWYPKIKDIPGINTPNTKIYPLHFEDQLKFIDKNQTLEFKKVVENIKHDSKELGLPMFLKNSLFSGKHNWEYTCAVKDLSQLENHIGSITDFAYGVGCEESLFLVARSWIDTLFTFTAFGGMPVTKERRYFVEDGKVTFHHPYWPPAAIKDPSIKDWETTLDKINEESIEEINYLKDLTEKVGKVLPGKWSVDWLQDKHGVWYLIDMAEKHKSFCWSDYAYGKKGL